LTTCISFGTNHKFDDIVVDNHIPIWLRIGYVETTVEKCDLEIIEVSNRLFNSARILMERSDCKYCNSDIFDNVVNGELRERDVVGMAREISE